MPRSGMVLRLEGSARARDPRAPFPILARNVLRDSSRPRQLLPQKTSGARGASLRGPRSLGRAGPDDQFIDLPVTGQTASPSHFDISQGLPALQSAQFSMCDFAHSAQSLPVQELSCMLAPEVLQAAP